MPENYDMFDYVKDRDNFIKANREKRAKEKLATFSIGSAILSSIIIGKMLTKLYVSYMGSPEQKVNMTPDEEAQLINRYKKERAVLIANNRTVYTSIENNSTVSRILLSFLRVFKVQFLAKFIGALLTLGLTKIAIKVHNNVSRDHNLDDNIKMSVIPQEYLKSVAIGVLVVAVDKLIMLYKARQVGNGVDKLLDVGKVKIVPSKLYKKIPIKSPKDLYKSFNDFYTTTPYEVFVIAFLDTNNVPQEAIYNTSGNFASVDFDAIIGTINYKSSGNNLVSVIGIHNHPQNQMELGIPSKNDIKFMTSLIGLLNKQKLYLKEFYVYSYKMAASSYYRKPVYYSYNSYSKEELRNLVKKYYNNGILRGAVDWDYLDRVQVIR